MNGERASDVQRVFDLFANLCPESGSMDFVTVPGAPRSKARPRVGARYNVYQPDKLNQDVLAWQMRAHFQGRRLKGNVALGCIFYRPDRHRIDIDNMLKLVMDAATGVVWDDDCQVTTQLGIIEMDPQNPRTLILFGEHASTLDRNPITRECSKCGADFEIDTPLRAQKFCSPRCRGRAIAQNKVRPGRGRGPKGQPPAACVDCGAKLSKRSYIRCRSCWMKARAAEIQWPVEKGSQ